MEDSPVRQSLLSQYRSSLRMLGSALEQCPADLWLSDEYKNRFWHIAYHAIFYTHLYSQPTEANFKPWSKHVPNSNYLGRPPWAGDEPFELPDPYAHADVLEYFKECCSEVDKQITLVRFEDPSGFYWLPFSKLELQLYNLRHLQHHTGQLTERLRVAANIGIPWSVAV